MVKVRASSFSARTECGVEADPPFASTPASHRGLWDRFKGKEHRMLGYGKRVLVVDDEEQIGRLLVDQLESHYFAVVAVADGLQALRNLHQRHFDAVITDLYMPYLDGLDLLRQCHLVWPKLPVILMGGDLPGIVWPLMAQGAFAYLPKPVDTEKLLHVLSEAITHRADPRSSQVEMQSQMLEAERCWAL